MVYNKADQLTSWPGMHTYTYYGDGSLHEEKNAAGTSTLKSYTYTDDGLLSEACYDRTSPTACTYLKNVWDADKNRVAYEVGSLNGTTHTVQYSHTFVYDTTAGIPAVIQEDGVYYVREPDGSLIARKDASDWSYYHFDQLGSTRLLTDSSGDVTDKYAYDAYGALLSHEQLTNSVDQPYQYVGELGYYTHWQEPGLGLMQLGVRFYDKSTARFIERDPIRDGWNYYGYTAGKPTTAVDPSGMLSIRDVGNYFYEHVISYIPGVEYGGGGFARAYYEYNVWEPMRDRANGQDFLACMGKCYQDFYSIGNACPYSAGGLPVVTGIGLPKPLLKWLGQRVIALPRARWVGNPWRQWLGPTLGRSIGTWWKCTYTYQLAPTLLGRAAQAAFWIDGGLEIGNLARCLGRCL